MRYLCLAYEEEEKLNALTEPEWHALRDETIAYVRKLQSNGHLVVTAALQAVHTATTVRVRGGRLSATDGPFAETKESLGGIFLIEAASRDEAVRLAAAWPSARIGSIEVRPIEESLPADRRYARA
jgi:hypothetical protein